MKTEGPTIAEAELTAKIYAEDRDTYHFGPPPYTIAMDIRCLATGRVWRLEISDFIAEKPNGAGIHALAIGIDSVKNKGEDAMRTLLSYLEAASQLAAVSFRRDGGEA